MKKLLLTFLTLAMVMPLCAQTWSKDLEKAAKSGDVTSQVAVAKAYLNGNGVEKNLPKSAKWLFSAANLGNKEAEQLLFSFYSKELEKYAKAGNADAQFHVGECYFNGNGVSKNLKKAAKWYDLAVAQKHEDAKKALGKFYSKELENRVKTEGDSELQYNLGQCYLNGIEVNVNKEYASKLFESAMNQGHAEAAKAFFLCDSKYTSNLVKTYRVNPMIEYHGYLQSGNVAGWQEANSYKADVKIVASKGNNKPYLTISGEKIGSQYSNASVCSEDMGFSFKGNALLGLQNHEGLDCAVVVLQKEGYLTFESQTIKLENDLTFDIINLFTEVKPWIHNDQKDGTKSDAKSLKNVSVKTIMPNLRMTSSQTAALKNVMKICPIDSVKCDVVGGFIIDDKSQKLQIAYTFDKNSYKNDQGLPDSVTWNKDKFYVDADKFVFISRNGYDKIVWEDDCIISLMKGYKDGVLNYNSTKSGKPSTVKLGTKGEFTGLCHISSLCAQNGIGDFNYITNIWNADKLSSLVFVIVEGDYVDANGVSVHWVHGRTETDHMQLIASMNERTARAKANRVASLKEARERAKSQLIAEGFNASDVNTLLYRCTVAKGMPRQLIRRAHELKSNLEIEMDCNLDGEPRQLIKIYNAETGELYFYQFVGYSYIFDTVREIENL